MRNRYEKEVHRFKHLNQEMDEVIIDEMRLVYTVY
jgi:hypothetical protein